MTMNCDLAINVDGEIKLSERRKCEDNDGYESDVLVENAGSMEVRFGYNDDDDIREEIGFYIEISEHHMVNAETSRGFHSCVTLTPDKAQLVGIRDFLNYLIDMRPPK